jgi:putative ATP-dependent endonuclease of OLD family
VILTTHSPGLAADLPVDSIRFVHSDGPADTPTIQKAPMCLVRSLTHWV